MRELPVTELQALVAAHGGQQPAPVLLDVREPWEQALGRIELDGSRSVAMPMNSVPMRLAELDRQATIVCICHHGARSARVAAFLDSQGFRDVLNLSGGTDAWSAQVDPRLPRY